MQKVFAIALLQSAVLGMKMTMLLQDPEDYQQVKPDLEEEPIEERLDPLEIGSDNHGFDLSQTELLLSQTSQYTYKCSEAFDRMDG